MRSATIAGLLLPALAMSHPGLKNPDIGEGEGFALICGEATLTTNDGTGAPNKLDIANEDQSSCRDVPAGKGGINQIIFNLSPSCTDFEFFTEPDCPGAGIPIKLADLKSSKLDLTQHFDPPILSLRITQA
ncbi:hypothetical protein K491DRAFT_726413 [Lophiostoma macrostomum CBS 122681]|uniref:Uncharacterized protein n=1 Tax=Lophiostoma macrostomum CBS 122681 TaxID=1314788 RepID=A0A6A6T156_9PLEO|nr:hypothetical protein K491DRAFT_726413 [Lophiostoma macrostomum CBS 122681]